MARPSRDNTPTYRAPPSRAAPSPSAWTARWWAPPRRTRAATGASRPSRAWRNGSYTVNAMATDAAGNTSPVSNINTFTVDATIPAAPVITGALRRPVTSDSTPTALRHRRGRTARSPCSSMASPWAPPPRTRRATGASRPPPRWPTARMTSPPSPRTPRATPARRQHGPHHHRHGRAGHQHRLGPLGRHRPAPAPRSTSTPTSRGVLRVQARQRRGLHRRARIPSPSRTWRPASTPSRCAHGLGGQRGPDSGHRHLDGRDADPTGRRSRLPRRRHWLRGPGARSARRWR